MRRRLQGNPVAPVKINADAISAILAPIYNELPKTVAAGQHNLTYGEIEWSTLKLMLDYVQKMAMAVAIATPIATPMATPIATPIATPKPKPTPVSSGRFYDLGSGRGRAVLFMALTGLFESSVGIEVLPERVSLAKQALLKLRAAIPNAGSQVKLYEASFLNPAFKYKDAKLIFLSNMCFDKETQDAIFARLSSEMPKGSLVFCSRLPDSMLTAFETIKVEQVSMTWTPSSEIHILRHL